MSERSEIVKSYEASVTRGLFLNGERFKWFVAVDPSLRVEPIDEHMHILWLPIMCEGIAPQVGAPDADEPTQLARALAWDEGYRRGTYDSEMDLDRADNPHDLTHAPDRDASETRGES